MNNKQRTYSLDEIKDELIGTRGSSEREAYEYELRMDLLGAMIRRARKERKLTQEALGALVGVQKAQISKIESSSHTANLATLIHVFRALETDVTFTVRLGGVFACPRGGRGLLSLGLFRAATPPPRRGANGCH
jgi:transcriptional regulator with XRE-family HTH domain